MSSATKEATYRWMVNHVDELPVELIEGVKIRRVLQGTAFDTVGCEYVVMEAGQELEPHVHERAHSFILIISGNAIVTLEGRDVPIGPGHLVYIPAGISHGFRTEHEPLVLYGFQCPPIIQSETKVDLLFDKDNTAPVLASAE